MPEETTAGEAWEAVHLFARELDRLLCGPVDELIRWFIARKGTTAPYFFIRYGEGGPHIRLRIFADVETREAFLHQVERVAGGNADILRVERQPYEPEFGRYGGRDVMRLAEWQFRSSSRAVLEMIRDAFPPTSAWRTAVAIRMEVAFALGCGMTPVSSSWFFTRLSDAWLNAAIKSDLPHEQKVMMQEHLRSAFEQSFAAQSDAVLELCSDLRTTADELERDESLGEFAAATRRYAAALGVNNGVAELTPRQWEALSGVVHMTSNRLGIVTGEEAFIAFMAGRVLASAASRA